MPNSKAKSRGRTFSLVAGVGVSAVLSLGLVYWKDILAQYYLSQLQDDADYLAQIIDANESTPKHLAIQKYLKTAEGKQGLFESYLKALQRELEQQVQKKRSSIRLLGGDFLGNISKMDLSEFQRIGFVIVNDSLVVAYNSRRGGSGSSDNRLLNSDHSKVLRQANRFMSGLFGQQFFLEWQPGVKFAVDSGNVASKHVGLYCGFRKDGGIGVLSIRKPWLNTDTTELPNDITEKDMEIMSTGVAVLVESID